MDNNEFKKRMEHDLLKLSLANFNINAGNSSNEYYVDFYAPQGSVYEGGIYKIRLTLPENYPQKSPSVGFVTKIFHPNVEQDSGSVCLDVISKNWSAIYDLNIIFETFLPQLLEYPNPSDPLNHTAASVYLRDYDRFKKIVKELIEKQKTSPTHISEFYPANTYDIQHDYCEPIDNDLDIFPKSYWNVWKSNFPSTTNNVNIDKYLKRIEKNEEPFSDIDDYPSKERCEFWKIATNKNSR